MHPNDPWKAPTAAAAEVDQEQWHGRCYLYDLEHQLSHELVLAAASAPTRIVTSEPAELTAGWDWEGDPVIYQETQVEYVTWLLLGSPVKIPDARSWSAIYCLEQDS